MRVSYVKDKDESWREITGIPNDDVGYDLRRNGLLVRGPRLKTDVTHLRFILGRFSILRVKKSAVYFIVCQSWR